MQVDWHSSKASSVQGLPHPRVHIMILKAMRIATVGIEAVAEIIAEIETVPEARNPTAEGQELQKAATVAVLLSGETHAALLTR